MTVKTSARRDGSPLDLDVSPPRIVVRDDRSMRITHLYGSDAKAQWKEACREFDLWHGYAPTEPAGLGEAV